MCALLVVSAVCQYGPPSRASPTTPPGVNIDDACREKGMCSVAYSSTTHRPYTDEHATQLYQISYPKEGPNGLRRSLDGTRSSRWPLAALSLAEQVSETGTSPSVTAWSPKGDFSADGGHFRSDGTPRGTTPPVDVKYGDGRFN